MTRRKVCIVAECMADHHALGYCKVHYNHYHKHQNAEAGRFLKKVGDGPDEIVVIEGEKVEYPKRKRRQAPAVQEIEQQPKRKRGRPRKADQLAAAAAKESKVEVLKEEQYQPEPYKHMEAGSNYSFFLNQPIIETIYGELYKIHHEPLYIASNEQLEEPLLYLCLQYAGYRDSEPATVHIFKEQLIEYVKEGNKIRFLYMLANWEQWHATRKNRKPAEPKQLTFRIE